MPPAPGPDSIPRARVPYLDGLRGIAILLVVTLHFVHMPYHPEEHPGSWFLPLHHLLGATWMGVDLFFVLSGFLLGGILMDHRAAPNLFRVFYLRRGCRILPAYYLFLSPLLVVPLLGLDNPLPALGRLLSTGDVPAWVYPLFLQNIAMTVLGSWGEAWISTTWSLAVEEQFYLLLPLIIRFVPRPRLPAVLVSLALLAPGLRLALHLWAEPGHAQLGAYTLLPCRWDSLLLGALVAWLVRDARATDWLRQHAGLLRGGWLVLALLGLLLAWFYPSLRSRPMSVAGYSLFALLFACTVLGCELGQLPGRSLLEWRPLRWVGRISYAFYLLHLPICSVIFHIFAGHHRSLDSTHDVLLMTVSFATSLLIAGLSWRLIEQPILRFGGKFSYRPAN